MPLCVAELAELVIERPHRLLGRAEDRSVNA
jgi:hypothetical protein